MATKGDPLNKMAVGIAEKLIRSSWNFQLNFGMNFLIFSGAMALAVVRFQGHWIAAIAAFTSGYFCWSMIEYSLHRWIFHNKNSPATRGHALHHREPQALIAVPFLTGFTVAVLLWLGLGAFLSESTTLFYISGMTVGYTGYGLLHYLFHHRTLQGSYLSDLQRHHGIHHRSARSNFGITNSYIDWLMGTLNRG